MKKPITPEDCTKAELCAFIRECVDWEGTVFKSGMLYDFIRTFRSETVYQELDFVSDALLEAIKRYNALLMPYAGKKIKEIPDDVLERAGNLAIEINKLKNRRKKVYRKYKKSLGDV